MSLAEGACRRTGCERLADFDVVLRFALFGAEEEAALAECVIDGLGVCTEHRAEAVTADPRFLLMTQDEEGVTHLEHINNGLVANGLARIDTSRIEVEFRAARGGHA